MQDMDTYTKFLFISSIALCFLLAVKIVVNQIGGI